ncbi:hypothetical protein STCU_11643 [Strigomonas culicis]|uniref:Uncharacterized protein n=1 Tax=Strigomonas culicis TaxID=28005 RepID=S9UZI0_9TRYP|nr:hypothetical protein STCU_11643 [Strigomonas culicis]|eukprot:EPY15960.1 hypothetical protein STCU_11643 [Strigomonas culicis]
MELRMLAWEARTAQLDRRRTDAAAAAHPPPQPSDAPLAQPQEAAEGKRSAAAPEPELELEPAPSTQPKSSIRDPVTKFIFEWLREHKDRETLTKQRGDIVGGLHAAALAAAGDLDHGSVHTPVAGPQRHATYNTRGLTAATSSSSSTHVSSTHPSSYGPTGGHRFLRGGEQLAVLHRRTDAAARPVLDAQERLQFHQMFHSAPRPSDATSSTATTRYTGVGDLPSEGIRGEPLSTAYAPPFVRTGDSTTATSSTATARASRGATSTDSSASVRPPHGHATTDARSRTAPPAADTQVSAGDQLTAAVLALQAKEARARGAHAARQAFDGPHLVTTQSPPHPAAPAQAAAAVEAAAAPAEARQRFSKAGTLPFN